MGWRLFRNRPIVTLLLCLIGSSFCLSQFACTRSIRDQGSKVAKAGSDLSKQMADYLATLQQDTVDTYELNAFRDAYLSQKIYERSVQMAKDQRRPLPRPPSSAMSEVDKQIFA